MSGYSWTKEELNKHLEKVAKLVGRKIPGIGQTEMRHYNVKEILAMDTNHFLRACQIFNDEDLVIMQSSLSKYKTVKDLVAFFDGKTCTRDCFVSVISVEKVELIYLLADFLRRECGLLQLSHWAGSVVMEKVFFK